MVEKGEGKESTREALDCLIEMLARTSVRASYDLGVDFDVDDPRVARWLILATLDGLYPSAAGKNPDERLRLAAEASKTDLPGAHSWTNRKGGMPLITWDDLIASGQRSEES